jgi:ubiquinone/menaquinone biosynthesis C-methylase UbiE
MSTILTEARIYDDLAEFYQLWREVCLGKKASEADELRFIADVFASSSAITSVIDLGGGVGVHAIALAKHGFDITLLDKSAKAISIAKRNLPTLKVALANFESIDLPQTYDAAICMLSSLTFILEESGQRHFYNWLKHHTRDLIILDQSNFHRYAKTASEKSFSERLEGEDKHFYLRIARDWFIENNLKQTSYLYEFVDKASEATKVIPDGQIQRYVPIEQLVSFLGKDWRLVALLGDYSLKHMFDEYTSPRMISVFKRV